MCEKNLKGKYNKMKSKYFFLFTNIEQNNNALSFMSLEKDYLNVKIKKGNVFIQRKVEMK